MLSSVGSAGQPGRLAGCCQGLIQTWNTARLLWDQTAITAQQLSCVTQDVAAASCGMHLPGTCALWQGMIWPQNTAKAHGKPMPTCHLHLRSATIMPLMASIALYMKP